MIKNLKPIHIILIVAAIFAASCAQIGRPEGGPRDTVPPVIERSLPKNRTTNFDFKRIVIEFDENIDLKKINDELIMSPPAEEKPEVKTNMNKLIVKFIDSLYSNTTYTLNFNNAITDLNEGNVYENYSYTFSTGAVIDSFRVNGKLIDAFTEEPVLGATVMLHRNLADSAFQTEVPRYIARTDSAGEFSVQNIAPGKYRLFALAEAKFNYTYEKGNDEGAFYPEIIVPEIETELRIDTLKLEEINSDTLLAANIDTLLNDSIVYDTIFRDSIVKTTEYLYFPDSIVMYQFKESIDGQYIAENLREIPEKLEISFNMEYDSAIVLEAVNFDEAEKMFKIERLDKKKFQIWLTDTTLFNKEELRFICRYHNIDSLKNPIISTDTLKFNYFKDKAEERKDTLLTVKSNIEKKYVELNEELSLTFSSPVNFIADSLKLFEIVKEGEEKIEKPLNFSVKQDSLISRKYEIRFKREFEKTYKVQIDSAGLADVYGKTNLEFSEEFQIQDSSAYSDIIVNISKIDMPSIVQLLDEKKEKVLKEFFISSDSSLNFEFLKPEKYYLKVIKDKNNNKKWDTGNYDELLLPEKVYIYKDMIETKAGWGNEINWPVGEKIIEETETTEENPDSGNEELKETEENK